jgi:hypothetical protein
MLKYLLYNIFLKTMYISEVISNIIINYAIELFSLYTNFILCICSIIFL